MGFSSPDKHCNSKKLFVLVLMPVRLVSAGRAKKNNITMYVFNFHFCLDACPTGVSRAGKSGAKDQGCTCLRHEFNSLLLFSGKKSNQKCLFRQGVLPALSASVHAVHYSVRSAVNFKEDQLQSTIQY